ncbi:tudor domain-containing protein 3 [Atheta coriaria]|uniref:tudor domain-containing protein 3 n=1 Tax=Dalotia coriaria TaxID=877792 RepID=UPI0031F45968
MSAVNLEKIDEKLSAQGWFISTEGLQQITQNGNVKDLRAITQNALDSDLKEIGKAILAEQLAKKLVNNVVLQIQKTKNISAPKANEDSQAAPRMLKLNLTDGHTHCQAIEIDNIGGLSLHKTAPGTKVLLKNAPVINGFLFLKPEMAIVLGGKVQAMFEKWEVNKNMSNVKRGDDADGPPAWVNFGRKIAGSETKDFKSLEDKTSKEDGKPTEFDVQRNVAIAEATTGAVKKVFGGGTKPLMKEAIDGYGYKREPREPREPRESKEGDRREFRDNREPRDRNNKPERRNKREPKGGKDDVVMAKPSDKVSLFAFLEDKLPETAQVVQTPQPQQIQQKPNNYNQKGNSNYNNKGQQHEKYDRYDNKYNKSGDYPSKQSNHYQNDYNKSGHYQNDYKSNNYQNDYKSGNGGNYNDYKSGSYQNDYKSSSSNYSRDNRRGNQPPRLQNKPVQQPAQPQYNNQQYQQFPPVQNFHSTPAANSQNVDDLANKMDRLNVNASFAKNAFKQHLNLPNQSAPKSNNVDVAVGAWKFNIGDLCMAKYWEDNKYYNATITGLTPKTCVVRFNEYGNMEEVLLEDCLPVSSEDNVNTGSVKAAKVSNGNEYRGNRNFVNRNRRH